MQRKFNGFYLFGRQGTSKTYTVCSVMEKLSVNYKYSNGHMTPIGLFNLIAENRDRTIVLDDVASIFNAPIALQILLAALGNPYDHSGDRIVRHRTARGEECVPYSGGIIAISNLRLDGHHQEILSAIRDRIFTLDYDPSDDQIIALIFKIAAKGMYDIAIEDCLTVAHFLITECKLRSLRPTVRLYVDKGLRDFEAYQSGIVETHWKDLVCSELEQQVVELKHPTKKIGRREQIGVERRIAADIYFNSKSPEERIANWSKLTGKSPAAYYRRIDELKKEGRIPIN